MRRFLGSSASALSSPTHPTSPNSRLSVRLVPLSFRSARSVTRLDGLQTSPDLGWPSEPNLTPYMILRAKPGEPYSKARYYDLAKVYHPDRYRMVASTLPNEVRLQRYHMVVAADKLLADPAKRNAYDRYGLGWSHCPRTTRKTSWHRHPDRSQGPGTPGCWQTDLQHRRLAVLIVAIAFFMQCSFLVIQGYKMDIPAGSLHTQSQRLLQARQRRASNLGLVISG